MAKDKIIGVFLLVAFLMGYDFFSQYPARKTMLNAQKASIGALKTNLFSAEDARDKIPKVEEEVKKSVASLTLMLKRFPKKGESGKLLEVLTQCIPKGIQIQSLSPNFGKESIQKVEAGKPGQLVPVRVEEVDIRVDFLAAFSDLGRFLENLENADMFLKVLSIMAKNTQNGEIISGSIVVKTYILDNES